MHSRCTTCCGIRSVITVSWGTADCRETVKETMTLPLRRASWSAPRGEHSRCSHRIDSRTSELYIGTSLQPDPVRSPLKHSLYTDSFVISTWESYRNSVSVPRLFLTETSALKHAGCVKISDHNAFLLHCVSGMSTFFIFWITLSKINCQSPCQNSISSSA